MEKEDSEIRQKKKKSHEFQQTKKINIFLYQDAQVYAAVAALAVKELSRHFHHSNIKRNIITFAFLSKFYIFPHFTTPQGN